ncbi:MAG: CoB--CoM heterodisulfide reductase iron-sulfur subunit B family protein, partial [Candidatus Bathyarchaeia archaeon]
MKVALYLGCNIQTDQYGFEMSSRETLPRLGVELVDVDGFSCCGYPLRSLNSFSWIYLSARNLAIADDLGLDILALCNGCHISMSEVKHILDSDPELRNSVNELLAIEGLRYAGESKVRHLIEVLYRDVGVEEIESRLRRPLEGLKFASHYGCHVLRPTSIGRPDEAEDPHILDDLTCALGADAGYYPEKLDCCGASLVVGDPETSFKLAGAKLRAVQSRGFDGMVTICPFCHKMYDAKQGAIKRVLGDETLGLPVLYYTQLLGLAM